MTYSFIKFNDEIVDSRIMMELTDLARLLFKDKNVTVSVRKFSYYHPSENIMNLSMFWKHRHDISEIDGFKHDIYTRFAQKFILDYAKYEQMRDVPVLLEQIFLSLEYYRTRRYAFSVRPLIKALVSKGDNILLKSFNKPAKNDADLLVRQLNTAVINNTSTLSFAGQTFNIICNSTDESIAAAKSIFNALTHLHSLPAYQHHEMPFNEIAEYIAETPFRKDSSALESDSEDDSEPYRNVDTKTNRDADDANVLGEVEDNNSKKSRHNTDNRYDDDVSDFTEHFGSNAGTNKISDEHSTNQFATLEEIAPKIRLKNYSKYRELFDKYNDTTNRIVGEMNQVLNFKQNEVHKNRVSGRLLKNPTSQIINDSHKLFYKKDAESKEFDAVFTLILDQSFSMTDYIEDAVEGIIIFNNILKLLKIEHRIISYHEDSFEVMDKEYPNKIYTHMDFSRSLYYYPISLLDIEASGDNRDGYILAHEIPLLDSLDYSDKFIIMFSDGLPSAENYNQSGVTDTHEAVNHAVRKGINIINIFIAEESDEATVSAIKNIYGTNTLIVKKAEEIPLVLPNLLNRILKSLIM